MGSSLARLYTRTVHSCPFKNINYPSWKVYEMFYSGFVVGFVVVVVLVVTWPHAEVEVILTCLVAPCPMRMDSYLCKQNEIKSPLHTISMSLEDGPIIQNVMLCVCISVSAHIWITTGANKSLNTHYTHYRNIIWNIDILLQGCPCSSTLHAV